MSIEGGGVGGGAAAPGEQGASRQATGVLRIPSRGTLMPRSASAARLAAAAEDELAAARKPLRGAEAGGGGGGGGLEG